ncbi:hypothetical protein IT575_10950 [bacterium]|nr:hypothetical protein [bacterium]
MPDQPADRAQYLRDLYGGPAAAALLWGMLFTGRVDPDVLAIIGLKEVDAELVREVYSERLKRMQMELKLGDLPLSCLARLARSLAGSLLAEAQYTRDPKLLRAASTALARLPDWSREPELYEMELEARTALAAARIEDANLRREESRGRRLRLKLLNDRLAAECAEMEGADGAGPVSAEAEALLEAQARLLEAPALAPQVPAQALAQQSAAAPAPSAETTTQSSAEEMQCLDSGAFSPSKVKNVAQEAAAGPDSRPQAPAKPARAAAS